MARATAAKSARPVDGTCRAATHRTCASSSPASPGDSSATVTPLALARSATPSSRTLSDSSVATTNFPHRSWAIPRSVQNSAILSQPSTANRAFSEPGW